VVTNEFEIQPLVTEALVVALVLAERY